MKKMVSRWVLLTLAFVFSSIVHSEEITLTASINTTKPNDQGHILDWDAGGKLFKKPEVFVSIDGGPFREMFYQYVSSYRNSNGYVYVLSLTGTEFPKSLVFLDNDVTRGGNDPIGQGECNESMEHCEIVHPSGQIAGYFKVESGSTPIKGIMEKISLFDSFFGATKEAGKLVKPALEFKATKSPSAALTLIGEAASIDKTSPLYTPAQCLLEGLDYVTRDTQKMFSLMVTAGINVKAAAEATNSADRYSKYYACSQFRDNHGMDSGYKTLACDDFFRELENNFGCNDSDCEKVVDQRLKEARVYQQLSQNLTSELLRSECRPQQ